ncbi:myomodulin neuropeptides 2-like [Physella acuta]|uniref:myomodulin neuropeptides 2-like n=1 Tax=Physella acuta TaxID=109671 RepID=UPI0027DAE361|nr:myomodulin neuropeptides 2-like [Physella acuta]
MSTIKSNCLYLFLIVIFAGYTAAETDPFTDDDVNDDDVSKRGWSMLRLGRGLQMLRLGKRGATRQIPMLRLGRSSADDVISPNDLQALLESLLEIPRDESRRQPPLPRYGRDSSAARRSLNSDDDDGIPTDFLPPLRKIVYRPAPRGGRYRRSLSPSDYNDFLLSRYNYQGQPMPERFVEAKAVPRPRIGRGRDDQSDNTSSVVAKGTNQA